MSQKRFSELRASDIEKLTREQVEGFVKIEFAYNGVKFLPRPTPPQKPAPMPDDFYFELSGTKLLSRNSEALQKILDTINSVREELVDHGYDWQAPISTYVAGPHTDQHAILKQQAYSKNQLDGFRAAFSEHKELEEAHRKEVKEYESNEKMAKEYADEIWDSWHRAREVAETRVRSKAKFAEYLGIASGDQKLARIFYEKAYGGLDREYEHEFDLCGCGPTSICAFAAEVSQGRAS